jgi:hypothetical protein
MPRPCLRAPKERSFWRPLLLARLCMSAGRPPSLARCRGGSRGSPALQGAETGQGCTGEAEGRRCRTSPRCCACHQDQGTPGWPRFHAERYGEAHLRAGALAGPQEAITRATSLEEVQRLEAQLKAGIMPGEAPAAPPPGANEMETDE